MNADLNYSFLVNRGIHPGQSGHKIAKSVLDYQYQASVRKMKCAGLFLDTQQHKDNVTQLEITQSAIVDELNKWNEMMCVAELYQ